jgi:hypothetical protein
MRHFYFINGGNNTVTINIASSGTFIDGLDQVVMPHYNQLCEIGGYHKTGVYTFYGRVNQVQTDLQVRRAATWSATNFASPAAIPFDTQDIEDNTSVSSWEGVTNPSRLTANLEQVYKVNYFVAINSTGGLTWTLEVWLRKNGTTEINGSRLRTGNFGNEDGSLTLPTLTVPLAEDDYLEVMIAHSSLTGNLHSATATMNCEV